MKYRMTQAGLDEFKVNKRQYLVPTVRGKLMMILSTGIGYTSDSLCTQVALDKRINASQGQIIREINRLHDEGLVEVSN